MTKLLKQLFWLLLILLVNACSNGSASNKYDKSDTGAPPSASADTSDYKEGISLNSPERKIIRTADFNCKVQNVFTATTQLENKVKSLGGIVQESTIANSDAAIKNCYYKPDSLRQTETYTTTCYMTLRVPAACIDSVIDYIPCITSFIDSRKLKQNDVTLAYLDNELKNKIDNTYAATQALRQSKKSKETIEAGEYEKNMQGQKIDRKIANLKTVDDVSYATISVAFSQPEQVYVATITNPSYFTEPRFSLQCKASLNSGWDIFKTIITCIITIWPLLLMGLFGWAMYRWLHNKYPFSAKIWSR